MLINDNIYSTMECCLFCEFCRFYCNRRFNTCSILCIDFWKAMQLDEVPSLPRSPSADHSWSFRARSPASLSKLSTFLSVLGVVTSPSTLKTLKPERNAADSVECSSVYANRPIRGKTDARQSDLKVACQTCTGTRRNACTRGRVHTSAAH